MSSRADLKHRMAAIGQTRQITQAMRLLSATRVRRDAHWIELTRAYFYRVRSVMQCILENAQGIEHPYLGARTGDRAVFIVMAGDKGLAGGYNHHVLAYALSEIQKHPCVEIIAVGQMARTFFEARGFKVNTDYVGTGQQPYLRYARRMVEHVFQLYDEGLTDSIYAVYTHYESALTQYPRHIKLLPIELYDYHPPDAPAAMPADVLYEPSPQAVFDTLVPEFAIGLLFGAMAQSYISEHTARMNAMESATQNADDMLGSLSRQYNLARQYAITQEISEISGAAEALRGRAAR